MPYDKTTGKKTGTAQPKPKLSTIAKKTVSKPKPSAGRVPGQHKKGNY